jgi:hypothetical protein
MASFHVDLFTTGGGDTARLQTWLNALTVDNHFVRIERTVPAANACVLVIVLRWKRGDGEPPRSTPATIDEIPHDGPVIE